MAKIKIKKGDTLSKLASQHNTTVPDLLKSNPNIKNPNLIYAGADLNIPDTTVKANITTPTTTSTTPTTPITTADKTTPIKDVVKEKSGNVDERDKLISRMTEASSAASQFDPIARRQELEEQRGISEKMETIGTFEEEIQRTNEFLDTLESDLKERTGDYTITESQRRRVLASEQAPLLKSLGILERGASTAESALKREQNYISDILGQEESASTKPLEILNSELSTREKINSLFPDQDSESVESIINAIDETGSEDPVVLYDALDGKVGINEITKTLEQIQSVREDTDKNTEVIEVGGRKLLIDKDTGETIKDYGSTTATTNPSEISKKFEEGEKVTEEEKELFKNSISQKVQELGAVSERNLGNGTLALYDNAKILYDLLNSGEVKTGPLAGALAKGGRATKGENALQNQFNAAATIFTANFIKAISGAQVSDKERKFLMGALPSEFKQEQVNKDNINMLLEYVTNQLEPLVGEDLSVLIPDPGEGATEEERGGEEKVIGPDGEEIIITD